MQPFTITNRITKADYCKLIIRKSYKQPLFILITVIGLLMLVAALLGTMGLIPMQDASDPSLFQFTFGAFTLALPFISKFQAAKTYDNSPRLHGEVSYTFSDSEINSQGTHFSNMYTWDTIIKREEVGKFMFLYTGRNVAEIFNKENFSKAQLNYIRTKI